MRRQLPLLFLLTLLWSGCVSRFSTEPNEAKQQILKEVPLGTPLHVAKERMEQMHFWCFFHRTPEQPVPFGVKATGPLIDCLTCSEEQSVFFGRKRWTVEMRFDTNQFVTNMVVHVISNPNDLLLRSRWRTSQ
jgi:hypothetical protein